MSDPVELNTDIPIRVDKETVELNNDIPAVEKQGIEVITDTPILGKIAPDLTANIEVVVNPKTV